MRDIIKEDILKVLKNLLKAVKAGDHNEIAELSNHVIHDASIFQEDDPLTLAVVVYALSKIYQRCCERNYEYPTVQPYLEQAYEALLADDVTAYRAHIKTILRNISKQDEKMKLYIQQVIERSKIKKASKLHEHGISIARTAELLDLSQWELQSYIGKTIREIPHDGMTVRERLQKTRALIKPRNA